jgi:hypothetical protein
MSPLLGQGLPDNPSDHQQLLMALGFSQGFW